VSNGAARVAKIFNVGKEAGGKGTLRLCGGSVTSGQFTMGEKASARGEAFIEGGDFKTTAEGWDVGYSGTGTVWQSGGTVTLKKYLFIGRAAGSKGTYVMTGGELSLTNAENHVYVGEFGKGTLLQSNGAIRVKNWLTVSRKTGSSGVYRLAGGSLSVEANLQLGEEAGSSARFEIAGTNGVISSKTFVATTNATLRFEIADGGVSKIAVQNQATLAGTLEVSVPYKLFDRTLTVIDAGSLSGQFNAVVPVPPLRAVDVAYEAATGNVTLSNFRYHFGTLLTVQ
jgi:T5SS/PEP-CTERM-associated repeat protein